MVYFTRSLHVQENEQVIRKVVDELSPSNDDSPFRLVSVHTSIRDLVLPESSFFESFVNLKNLPTDIGKLYSQFRDQGYEAYCKSLQKSVIISDINYSAPKWLQNYQLSYIFKPVQRTNLRNWWIVRAACFSV